MCDGSCETNIDWPCDECVARVAAADAIVLELMQRAERYDRFSTYSVLEHEPFVYEGPQDYAGYIAQAYDLAASRYWGEAYAPGCPPSEIYAS